MVGLLCLGALKAGAATTNLVQTINMAITAYAEGDTTTNGAVVTTPVLKMKASVKDIIQLLGDATTNTFSAKAKLLLITPLPDGESSIVVEDGTNRVDVSDFFDAEDQGEGVGSTTVNTLTGIGKATHYRMFELELRDNGSQVLEVHFRVAGLSTIKSATIGKPGAVIGMSHSVSAVLAGTGDFTDDLGGTQEMIVQMTLTTIGTKTEVVP